MQDDELPFHTCNSLKIPQVKPPSETRSIKCSVKSRGKHSDDPGSNPVRDSLTHICSEQKEICCLLHVGIFNLKKERAVGKNIEKEVD